MKSNEPENKMQNEPANELNEKDLENVSGGLGGITLLDLCKGKFDEIGCLNAFFEPCPQLVVCDHRTTDDKNGSTQELYVYTCKKGCFKDLKLLKSVTY
jgi:bacteriocin-like protein